MTSFTLLCLSYLLQTLRTEFYQNQLRFIGDVTKTFWLTFFSGTLCTMKQSPTKSYSKAKMGNSSTAEMTLKTAHL